MNRNELKFALENGMIDETYIQAQIDMIKRKELLEKHPHKIWQGKDGKWYTYIDDDFSEKRVLKKRASYEDLVTLVVKNVKAHENNPTIRELFNEWNDRRLELHKIVHSSHLRYLKLFDKHFAEFGKRRIKDVEPDEVIEFLEGEIPRWNMTAKSFSNLKTVTKGVFKRAKRLGLINWNVEEIIYGLDVSEREFKKVIKEDYQEVYNDEEKELLEKYLIDNQDTLNLGILLMFATGVRVGELMALKPEDIVNYNAINIRRTETCMLIDGKYIYAVKEHPKTSAGTRTVVVPDKYSWVVKAIKHNNPFGEYLFEKNGKRMTVRAMEARLRRLCDKLGIYRKSPHKIRKTYGSILLDNHVDSRLILDQMGHTNIMTTERAYHRNRRRIDGKRGVLNELPEFHSEKRPTLINQGDYL